VELVAVQYQHTQRGTVSLAIVASTIALYLALCMWIGIRVPHARLTLMFVSIAPFVILVPVAWYFSSMTVVVTHDELRWCFGLGRDWRVARADIESATIVRHGWLGGYGLRWYGPKRWVYIVSGRDTVEVRLKQGGWKRLGTDDPQGLLRSLASKPTLGPPMGNRKKGLCCNA
jgi:hypothetical protein